MIVLVIFKEQKKLILNSDTAFYIAYSMNDLNRHNFNCYKINDLIKKTYTIKYLGTLRHIMALTKLKKMMKVAHKSAIKNVLNMFSMHSFNVFLLK